MRLLLKLNCGKEKQIIPVNYQYPLSSAIYKILQNADEEYSAFLHEKGYGKGFKLFTFSDIKSPFRINGDRMMLLSHQIEIIVCFHLPNAAETFIKGLFISQQIDIADKKNKVRFTVEQIESLASPFDSLSRSDGRRLSGGSQSGTNNEVEVLIKPLSPIVCGLKKENGNYDFLSPEDSRYNEMLFKNWREKCKAAFEKETVERIMASAFIQAIFYKNPPRSRLITIKAGTDAETKIRGFNNFEISVRGEKAAVELLLNCGVGLYNAQGMGCVEITQ